ncbi:hypothetical protein Aduo_008826 [Ancylostoma duodenale]
MLGKSQCCEKRRRRKHTTGTDSERENHASQQTLAAQATARIDEAMACDSAEGPVQQKTRDRSRGSLHASHDLSLFFGMAEQESAKPPSIYCVPELPIFS